MFSAVYGLVNWAEVQAIGSWLVIGYLLLGPYISFSSEFPHTQPDLRDSELLYVLFIYCLSFFQPKPSHTNGIPPLRIIPCRYMYVYIFVAK